MIYDILRSIKLSLFSIKFRLANKHNRTFPVSNFPIQSVSIGNETYGPLNVIWMASKEVKLKIGHYCSIGPEVTFLVGGDHNYHRISTFPFQSYIYQEPTVGGGDNRDIIIEDDVWIGYGTLVMSGVRIGKGAVIGAKSIVAKDIPPYSIYIGNKVIKKRFPDVIIDKLLSKVDYSKIKHKKGDSYQQYCQEIVTSENIDEICNEFIK